MKIDVRTRFRAPDRHPGSCWLTRAGGGEGGSGGAWLGFSDRVRQELHDRSPDARN
jgi:hypothetical protein